MPCEIRAFAVSLVLVTACTVGASAPPPVTARPRSDPDRMPSEVLDRQDPGADTSRNPVLSRSETNPWWSRMLGLGGAGSRSVEVVPSGSYSVGCGRLLGCVSAPGGDTSGALVVLAALGATRRRKRS